MINKKSKIIFISGLILFIFSFVFFLIKNFDYVKAAIGSKTITVNARLTGLSEPISSNDAATKGYVDSVSGQPSNWTCREVTSSATFNNSAPNPVYANCSSSEKVIVGGCYWDGSNYPIASFPVTVNNNQGWGCRIYGNTLGVTGSLEAHIFCCQ